MNKYPTLAELKSVVHSKEVSKNWSWNMWAYRKISVYITCLLIRTKITPNQITAFWISLGIIGCLLLIPGGYTFGLIGMVVYQIALLSDLLDGELARFRSLKDKNAYLKGAYLDIIGHYTHRGLIMACMGIWAYNTYGDIWYLYAGFAATLGILLDNLYKLKKYEALCQYQKFDEIKKYYSQNVERKKNKFVEFLHEILRPNNLSLVLWAGIFGFIDKLIIVYAILLPLLAVRSLFGTLKSLNYVK